MHTPGVTNSTVYQFAEDLSLIHGAHQIGFGANFIHSIMNYTASTATPGMFVFNATNTGLSLGDFMTGKPNSWTQSQISAQYKRQNYIGMYIQDTWKATSKLTLNGGVRWEPFLFPYDARAKTALPAGLVRQGTSKHRVQERSCRLAVLGRSGSFRYGLLGKLRAESEARVTLL